LRFTLLVGSTPGNDTNLSLKKVEANRNFANKIWNATRFIITAINRSPQASEGEPDWSLADSWIWAKYQALIRDVNRMFENYQFGEAGRQIYEFFWGDFADWYIEIAKLQLAGGGDRAFYTTQTLVRILDGCLRLLHPFTPFVTEELWGHLKSASKAKTSQFDPKEGWAEALIVARWPEPSEPEGWEAQKVKDFNLIQDTVSGIRNWRSENGIDPNRLLPAKFVPSPSNQRLLFTNQMSTIASLARLNESQITIIDELSTKPDYSTPITISGSVCYLPIDDMFDPVAEKKRLAKELAEVNVQIKRLSELLAGPFAAKAPAGVVNKEREKLDTYRATAVKLKEQIADLER
jgi:valyl-tRNA synthetase